MNIEAWKYFWKINMKLVLYLLYLVLAIKLSTKFFDDSLNTNIKSQCDHFTETGKCIFLHVLFLLLTAIQNE